MRLEVDKIYAVFLDPSCRRWVEPYKFLYYRGVLLDKDGNVMIVFSDSLEYDAEYYNLPADQFRIDVRLSL